MIHKVDKRHVLRKILKKTRTIAVLEKDIIWMLSVVYLLKLNGNKRRKDYYVNDT